MRRENNGGIHKTLRDFVLLHSTEFTPSPRLAKPRSQRLRPEYHTKHTDTSSPISQTNVSFGQQYARQGSAEELQKGDEIGMSRLVTTTSHNDAEIIVSGEDDVGASSTTAEQESTATRYTADKCIGGRSAVLRYRSPQQSCTPTSRLPRRPPCLTVTPPPPEDVASTELNWDESETTIDYGMMVRFFLIPFGVASLSGMTHTRPDKFYLVFPRDPFLVALFVFIPTVVVSSLVIIRLSLLYRLNVQFSFKALFLNGKLIL